MPRFYCLLGNTPQLSLLELQSLLGAEVAELVSPQVAQIETDQEPQLLMNQLGGVVKLCQPIKSLPASQPADIEQAVAEYLASLGQAKVEFGVAEVGRNHQHPISLTQIKKQLQKADISVRFVESPRDGLSASVLLHQTEVIEVVVLPVGKGWELARTVAIQNIDAWTKRDRSKPYADRRKGMLPPKVARMMVNIALGHLPGKTEPRIYDPFCGSGTVLMEAALAGCPVVGSDLDDNSVKGTQANLEWLAAEENLKLDAQIFLADVSQARPDQVGGSVDAIVTEPFLGKPTPRVDQLPGTFKGLYKLYLGAFKRWTQLVKPGGVVVMVFPYVATGKAVFSLESLIDKLAPLGYTIVSEPVLYHRPQAVVQRQIHIFRYQPK